MSRLWNSQGKSTNSSKGDAAMAFHYDDSSMYVAVGDINYIAYSITALKMHKIQMLFSPKCNYCASPLFPWAVTCTAIHQPSSMQNIDMATQ